MINYFFTRFFLVVHALSFSCAGWSLHHHDHQLTITGHNDIIVCLGEMGQEPAVYNIHMANCSSTVWVWSICGDMGYQLLRAMTHSALIEIPKLPICHIIEHVNNNEIHQWCRFPVRDHLEDVIGVFGAFVCPQVVCGGMACGAEAA